MWQRRPLLRFFVLQAGAIIAFTGAAWALASYRVEIWFPQTETETVAFFAIVGAAMAVAARLRTPIAGIGAVLIATGLYLGVFVVPLLILMGAQPNPVLTRDVTQLAILSLALNAITIGLTLAAVWGIRSRKSQR